MIIFVFEASENVQLPVRGFFIESNCVIGPKVRQARFFFARLCGASREATAILASTKRPLNSIKGTSLIERGNPPLNLFEMAPRLLSLV